MVDERRQQLRLEGSIPGQLTSATIATSTVYGEQSLQWRSQIERAGRCNFFPTSLHRADRDPGVGPAPVWWTGCRLGIRVSDLTAFDPALSHYVVRLPAEPFPCSFQARPSKAAAVVGEIRLPPIDSMTSPGL